MRFLKKFLNSISNFFQNKFNLAIQDIKKLFSNKDFIAISTYRSESENGLYVSLVKKAVKEHKTFKSFKRHRKYRTILEHVTREDGQKYLNIIKKQSKNYLLKITDFKENDLVGNPLKYHYDQIGNISPTTLRYIKVASDLERLFGKNLGKIAEIGVGYGGQLLILDKVFTIKHCDLYDLPPVLELTSKYLESYLLNSSYSTLTLNNCDKNKNYDLVLSNYAFSELPVNVQLMYIDKILKKSKKGYLTMNSGLNNSAFLKNHLTLKDLKRLLPKFSVIPENPLTSRGNYIIIWGVKEK